MRWRAARCSACNRPVAACICASVQRRHDRENRRQGQPGQYVAHPANGARRWCSACGCLVREGRCVSATCGKTT